MHPQVLEYCKDCHHYCKRGYGAPLDLARNGHKVLMARWSTFCWSLQKQLISRPAGDFRLVLTCDCKNEDTAQSIVRSLSEFPILQHATIRLGQSTNEILRILAENTVRRLTSNTDLLSTFTFFPKLPNEIQELILTKTDLIAPLPLSWHEVMTHPEGVSTDLPLDGTILKGFRLYHDKLQPCCRQCTLSGEVCACPTRHAAYTSRVCKCWDFPKSLFLVSRSINRLATRIFFAKNQIVLWESSFWQDDRDPAQDFSYLVQPRRFLTEVPLFQLGHIRWLRLTFICFEDTDCQDGSAFRDAWIELTIMIKWLPLLEQLTVELDYADNILWKHPRWESDWVDSDYTTAFETYTDIVNLSRLPESRHYKNFFVRLSCPARFPEDDWRRWNLERELERSIMGDAYDAVAAGKYSDKLRWDESLRPKYWLREDENLDWHDKSLYVP